MKTLYNRFKAEVPKFWKRVQKVLITVGCMATALWQVNLNMDLNLDANVITVCKYVIAICAVCVLQAQFTIKDSNTPTV